VFRGMIGVLMWLVEVATDLFLLAVFLRAVASWVSADPANPLYRFLLRLTEPVLGPIRRRLPVRYGGFDLSPVAAFILAWVAQAVILGLLRGLASTL